MNKKDIRSAVRKHLLEKKGDTHDYGCVMLYFNIKKEAWDKFQDMIADEDIYTEVGDQSYGREDEPHVTILYGLHADIPDLTIEGLIDEMEGPELNLKKISIFENDKFDVVKFDIIGESEKKLAKMNAMFVKLPHTTSYPDYHPHSTCSYVKKGAGKKYIQTLSDDKAMIVKCNKVVYSKADGSKKEYPI